MGNFYLNSSKRTISKNIVFAIVIVIIVAVSTVFSAYVLKFGEAVGTRNNNYEIAGKQYFDYNFVGSPNKSIGELFDYKDDTFISINLSRVPFIKGQNYEESIVNDYSTLNYFAAWNLQMIVDRINNGEVIADVSITDLLNYAPKYFVSQKELDKINEKNHTNYNLGDKVKLFDCDYVLYEDKSSYEVINNYFIPSKQFIVKSAEIAGNIYISYYTIDELYNREIKEIEQLIKVDYHSNLLDEIGFFILFLILAGLIMAVFAINVFVLFRNYLKNNDKIYTEYKMLGATNKQVGLAMAIDVAILSIIGFIIGIGIEFAICKHAIVFDKVRVLSWWQVLMLLFVNILVMVSVVSIAFVKKAKQMPIDSKKGVI